MKYTNQQLSQNYCTLLIHTITTISRPDQSSRSKHGILKNIKKDKSIVILRSDKGNGVLVLDRIQYDNVIKEIISD